MTVTYREHAPDPRLARFVECYWSIRHDGGRSDVVDRVLPDGCMDVIFSLAAPPTAGTDGDGGTRGAHGPSDTVGRDRPAPGALPPGASVAVGTMTAPLAVRRTNAAHLWGVRFRPGAGAALIGVAAHELTDRVVPLSDLWRARAVETFERLAEARSDTARRDLLDDLVMRSLDVDGPDLDDRILVASEAVARSGGTLPVEDLARTVCLSRRQLERGFLDAVGVSPKVAGRVARLRRSLELLADPDLSLSRVALRAGYADQAHFTRDFRGLTGATPGAYRAQRRS